eukprot:CAMPEP_0201887090 /NCGR_PEP_ID=MMETSP0902-20130614/24067_1 /ASSEMBLY_ACC=CAM_ASM_000551 /TAXON_ID=420261 /ORGANISM="Thalassiosira antarctica, Strain CCMP982" /LENGTH=52 /DNA_ID=CAMNT_0048416901 /DNA_START=45 /DNA_END=200 /DNA_ORIENTATION=+
MSTDAPKESPTFPGHPTQRRHGFQPRFPAKLDPIGPIEVSITNDLSNDCGLT